MAGRSPAYPREPGGRLPSAVARALGPSLNTPPRADPEQGRSVHARFVRGMRRGFELERRVLHVEVTGKTALQLVEQLR